MVPIHVIDQKVTVNYLTEKYGSHYAITDVNHIQKEVVPSIHLAMSLIQNYSPSRQTAYLKVVSP